jgi:hypothetical protein
LKINHLATLALSISNTWRKPPSTLRKKRCKQCKSSCSEWIDF